MTDRLFAECCYGTHAQHPETTPCPRLRCIGCGGLADAEGETGCDCPTGGLSSKREGYGSWWNKPSRDRERIADLERQIEVYRDNIAATIARAALQTPPESGS